jgi:general secretion pathway protein D
MSLRTARGASPLLLLALTLTAGAAAGCASSTALHRGSAAEERQDYDAAVAEYTNALRAHPNDKDIRVALERAKLRASSDHFNAGRRFAATGKLDQALVEYQLALELNPTSSEIDTALRDVRVQLRNKVIVAREGKTELQTLIEKARDVPPAGLDLPANVTMPATLTFRGASSRDVYLAIARFADLSLAFDPTFRETLLTVDLRNATLEGAMASIAEASQTFYRVTAPRAVLVIPDTPAKRREYEEEVVRTFYLSNADLKETMDLLRMVLDARRVSPITATNAVTVKDTPERIAAAGRVISAIDKARPEVIIDVELLEVDRTKLAEYGLQIASPGSPGIDGSASVIGSGATTGTATLTLDTLRNLTASDVLLANFPGLYYRLLKSDTNTRTLANPQLRTSEGMPAQARFGDRIPVPVTTFAPIATGGVPQQPIVSYNYENIGVNIDITPRTHHDDDVTLALKVAVQAISGTGFGNLPTFANREISTTIRLRDGETNMLAGLIRDDERRVLEGVPGLSDLPVLGRIFTHTQKETTQTDIILTLTPHIVRVLDLDERDLAAFRVGRDSGTASAGVLPLLEPTRPLPNNQPVQPAGPGAAPTPPAQPEPANAPAVQRPVLPNTAPVAPGVATDPSAQPRH